MKLLLIDTCGIEGSVALADAGCQPVRIVSATLPGRSASERLLPVIRELAAQSGLALRDLNALAAVTGPGSFTGVRVGLAAAKGLCQALGLPLLAISRLEVLARMGSAGANSNIFSVLDAGRGQFYVGEYLNSVKAGEALADRSELACRMEQSSGPTLIVCEEAVAREFQDFTPQIVAMPDAVAAIPLAAERLAREQFDDLAAIDANYLRRTDLEIFAKMKASGNSA